MGKINYIHDPDARFMKTWVGIVIIAALLPLYFTHLLGWLFLFVSSHRSVLRFNEITYDFFFYLGEWAMFHAHYKRQ